MQFCLYVAQDVIISSSSHSRSSCRLPERDQMKPDWGPLSHPLDKDGTTRTTTGMTRFWRGLDHDQGGATATSLLSSPPLPVPQSAPTARPPAAPRQQQQQQQQRGRRTRPTPIHRIRKNAISPRGWFLFMGLYQQQSVLSCY